MAEDMVATAEFAGVQVPGVLFATAGLTPLTEKLGTTCQALYDVDIFCAMDVEPATFEKYDSGPLILNAPQMDVLVSPEACYWPRASLAHVLVKTFDEVGFLGMSPRSFPEGTHPPEGRRNRLHGQQ